jgi:hypothetical protein
MANEPISYYFTLFKKFQVLGHVPGQLDHGVSVAHGAAGGFSLLDPASVQAYAAPGNTNLSNCELYQLLNAGALGLAAVPSGVAGAGLPPMPLGATATYPPGWSDFQTGVSSGPTLVQDIATWIQAGSTYDIPAGVIAQVPTNPPGNLVTGVVSPYVFSMPGDTGVRPDAVPGNFWATSLIFLVDPGSGNTVAPNPLTGEYWLCAVIGNNGDADGGQFLSNTSTYVQAQAYIMPMNTVAGPAVQLPSLSDLDPNDVTDLTYDQYALWNGATNVTWTTNNVNYPACYDVVGFRFNVQTAYNNLIVAVQNAVTGGTLTLPPGVTTAQEFVLGTVNSPAHVCAKVLVGQGPGAASFPSLNASPLTIQTIGQKNLGTLDSTLNLKPQPQPMMSCAHFVIGQPDFIPVPGAGGNILTLETTLPREQFRLYLSFRSETFKRLFGEASKDRIKGFRQIAQREIAGGRGAALSHDAVVLQYEGGDNRIEIPALPTGHFHGTTLCMEFDPTRVKPGNLGEISLVHRALLPKLTPGTRCFEIEETVAGGFTLQVRAFDPSRRPKGKTIKS